MKSDAKNPSVFFTVFVLTLMTVLALGAMVYLVFLRGNDVFPKKQTQIRYADLPYKSEVALASEKYGLEEARIYAVIQTESSFRPEAVSSSGAIGLMQMLPETYEELCKKRGVESDKEDLKDPAVNIDFCCEYLTYLYNLFGDWNTAHVAYHAGPGNVTNWLNDPEYSADGKTVDRIPSATTAKYLERINAAMGAYRVAIAAQKAAMEAYGSPSPESA